MTTVRPLRGKDMEIKVLRRRVCGGAKERREDTRASGCTGLKELLRCERRSRGFFSHLFFSLFSFFSVLALFTISLL
jgi:hypothetical protein